MANVELVSGPLTVVVADSLGDGEAASALRAADVPSRVEAAIHRAWATIEGTASKLVHPREVRVSVGLGDPKDRLFIEDQLGYINGGTSLEGTGLVLWPTQDCLEAVEAVAAHEFGHVVRLANAPAGGFGGGLGSWVVAEGLCEVLSARVCGDHLAGRGYRNIDAAALAHAVATIAPVLGRPTSVEESWAYMMGDRSAEKWGYRPVGLPHMAGYAVGRHLVEKYLEATGATLATALCADHNEILTAAAR